MKFGEVPPAVESKEDDIDVLLRAAEDAGRYVLDLMDAARSGKVTPEMLEEVARHVEEHVWMALAAVSGKSGEVMERVRSRMETEKKGDDHGQLLN